MDRNKRIRKHRPGTPQKEGRKMHTIGSKYERELFFKEFPHLRDLNILEYQERTGLSPEEVEEAEKEGWRFDTVDSDGNNVYVRTKVTPVKVNGFEVKLGSVETLLGRGYSRVWVFDVDGGQRHLKGWQQVARQLEFDGGRVGFVVVSHRWDYNENDGGETFDAEIVIYKPPKDGGWIKAFADAKESVRQEMNAAMMIE